MTEIMMSFAQVYKEFEGFDHPPLHDPCTINYVIDPSLYTGEHYYLDAEHKEEKLFGKLHWGKTKDRQ